jgi:hypothetical protein
MNPLPPGQKKEEFSGICDAGQWTRLSRPKKAQADPSAAVREVPAAALVVASAAEQSRAE